MTTAKHPGPCQHCGGRIEPGRPIAAHPDGWQHADCAHETDYPATLLDLDPDRELADRYEREGDHQ